MPFPLSFKKTLLQAPSVTFPPHISLKSLTWFYAHLHTRLSVIWVLGFARMHKRQCFFPVTSLTSASRAFLSVYWQRQAKAGVKICPFSITIIYQTPPFSRTFLNKQTKELLPVILQAGLPHYADWQPEAQRGPPIHATSIRESFRYMFWLVYNSKTFNRKSYQSRLLSAGSKSYSREAMRWASRAVPWTAGRRGEFRVQEGLGSQAYDARADPSKSNTLIRQKRK